MHEVTIVTIDEVDSVVVLQFVTIVKQGIEAENSQRVESTTLELKS